MVHVVDEVSIRPLTVPAVWSERMPIAIVLLISPGRRGPKLDRAGRTSASDRPGRPDDRVTAVDSDPIFEEFDFSWTTEARFFLTMPDGHTPDAQRRWTGSFWRGRPNRSGRPHFLWTRIQLVHLRRCAATVDMRRSVDYFAGSNSSMGLPSGSSSWICLPPGPTSISLRKWSSAFFSRSMQVGRSETRRTTRFHPPGC